MISLGLINTWSMFHISTCSLKLLLSIEDSKIKPLQETTFY